MKKQVFTLTYPWAETWDKNGYKPEVTFELGMNKEGFTMDIVVIEADPKREKTEHFQFVHEDSCVEWFANFFPEQSDRYFNFEVNANGIMNVSFRKDRNELKEMDLEDIASLGIKAKIYETYWTVSFVVPFTLIEKYIPEYEFKPGMKISSNFYKCGAKTEFPHHGIWNPMPLKEPDHHRPEYFKEIILEKENEQMKSWNIVFTGPEKVEVLHEDVPALKPNEVLCRTDKTLISIGTEMRCLAGVFDKNSHWDTWVKYPFYPGYSNSAVVVEVGSEVKNFKPGDRVSSDYFHKQYFTANESALLPIPEGVDMKDATFIAILRVAQNIVRKCQIQMGDTVVVIGQGPIGQMVTQFVRICGAMKIIAVDPMETRAEMSWKSGATHVLSCGADVAKDKVKEINGGKLADVVIDTTGHHKVLAQAVALTRRYGKVGLVGDAVNPSEQVIGEGVISKSLSIIGAHGDMTAPYDNDFYPWTRPITNGISMQYIQQKRLNLQHLISHVFSPMEAPKVYEALQKERSSYVGVIFDWDLLE